MPRANTFARHDLFAPDFALSCLNRLQLRNNQEMLDLADPSGGLQMAGRLVNPPGQERFSLPRASGREVRLRCTSVHFTARPSTSTLPASSPAPEPTRLPAWITALRRWETRCWTRPSPGWTASSTRSTTAATTLLWWGQSGHLVPGTGRSHCCSSRAATAPAYRPGPGCWRASHDSGQGGLRRRTWLNYLFLKDVSA